MSERGMMKWAPYKSLNEQGDFLLRMKEKKKKIPKPTISSEEAEAINEVLVTYGGEMVSLTLFEDGSLIKLEGKIEKIDEIYHQLLFDGRWLSFKNIIRLEKIN